MKNKTYKQVPVDLTNIISMSPILNVCMQLPRYLFFHFSQSKTENLNIIFFFFTFKQSIYLNSFKLECVLTIYLCNITAFSRCKISISFLYFLISSSYFFFLIKNEIIDSRALQLIKVFWIDNFSAEKNPFAHPSNAWFHFLKSLLVPWRKFSSVASVFSRALTSSRVHIPSNCNKCPGCT